MNEEKYLKLCHRIIAFMHDSADDRFKMSVESGDISIHIKMYYILPGTNIDPSPTYTHHFKTYEKTIEWLLGFTWIQKILRNSMSPEELDLQLAIRGY